MVTRDPAIRWTPGEDLPGGGSFLHVPQILDSAKDIPYNACRSRAQGAVALFMTNPSNERAPQLLGPNSPSESPAIDSRESKIPQSPADGRLFPILLDPLVIDNNGV
jgi:hypothetical protein